KCAKPMSVPHANSSVTAEIPSFEIERTRRKFGTVPTPSSITFVIRFSISSGAALGYLVITCSCGTEMFGKSSCGICTHARNPKTTSPMKTIVVITGRLTNSEANFSLSSHHFRSRDAVHVRERDVVGGQRVLLGDLSLRVGDLRGHELRQLR